AEAGPKQPAGERHTDAVSDPLTEGTGARLDARSAAALRVTGRHAPPLPERLDLLERQAEPGEVQERVLQHAAVSRRQDEAVPIGPGRVPGIEAQVARPEVEGVVGGPHRHPRMAGAGPLDGIDRERLDGVD